MDEIQHLYRRALLATRICLVVIALVSGRFAISAEQSLVAVVNPSNAEPFLLTQKNFEQSLQALLPARFVQVGESFDDHPVESLEPDLVFALGSMGAKRARQLFGDTPLLASLLISTSVLEGSSNSTAILLTPAIREQLNWHKRILPSAKRVGVLYNPENSAAWVKEAATIAPEMNLELVSIPVSAPNQLPAALKALARKADSILGLPDPMVYSNKTAKAILLFSFRNRIPFVGMSQAWVKAGALYSLDVDYENLGRQSATVAQQLLATGAESFHAPHLPEKLVYHLNLKTAKHMKLDLQQQLIAGATLVYE